MKALIDSSCEVNEMHPSYTKKLSMHIKKSDIGTHKINRSYLDTLSIVIAGFSFKDKLRGVWFF